MKKILFITILLFTISISNAYAYEVAPNTCLDDNSCRAVCSYTNQFDVTRIITIYYHFNGDWSVSYWNGIADIGEYMYYGDIKGPNIFKSVFSKTGSPNIYWELDDINDSNFRCPDHAFFDRNAFVEICFSDDSEVCENKSDLVSTKFGKEDSAFQYDKKDYDFEDDIENYKDWIFGDIKDEISNGTFDVEKDLQDKILKDFETNYLNNSKAPAFMVNSPAYLDLMNSVEEAYEKAKEEALQEAEEELDDGNITDEEYNEIINNWDNDVEQVVNQATTAFENIKLNSFIDIDFDVSDGCKSYLGDPSDSGSPAYYLQFSFNIMKYAAIIMLFVFTFIDFTKAVASSKDDAIKKATQNAIKRVIIAIIIFFLPILIEFLLSLFGIYSNCGIS